MQYDKHLPTKLEQDPMLIFPIGKRLGNSRSHVEHRQCRAGQAGEGRACSQSAVEAAKEMRNRGAAHHLRLVNLIHWEIGQRRIGRLPDITQLSTRMEGARVDHYFQFRTCIIALTAQ